MTGFLYALNFFVFNVDKFSVTQMQKNGDWVIHQYDDRKFV